jgi:hypothetical protein
MGQLGGSIGAQQVEEFAQRGLVASFPSPHQATRVMIYYAEEIPLSSTVGNLVDPDPPQPRQPIGTPGQLGHHPDHDRGHRVPGNPLHDRQRRQGDDRHPMLDATHPRRVSLQKHPSSTQVQAPPPALALTPSSHSRSAITSRPWSQLLGLDVEVLCVGRAAGVADQGTVHARDCSEHPDQARCIAWTLFRWWIGLSNSGGPRPRRRLQLLIAVEA